MVVELDAEALGARVDLVAMHPRSERRLLQLLLDGLRLERGDPVGANESAGVHEARQLVTGEERPLERRVPRDRQVLGVRKHRLDELLGIALIAQDGGAVLRMLVERGVDLVVEVVEEGGRPPELLVRAKAPGVSPHGSLYREGVPAQWLGLRIPGQRLPGAVSRYVHTGG